jgi:hypothetical protein
MSEPAARAFHRRQFLESASLLSLAAMVPELAGVPAVAGAGQQPGDTTHLSHRGHRFFTAHEAAVVDAAVRRIAPGPHDDPLEVGHPGAPYLPPWCQDLTPETIMGFSADTPACRADRPMIVWA